jgi:hypothetical protein
LLRPIGDLRGQIVNGCAGFAKLLCHFVDLRGQIVKLTLQIAKRLRHFNDLKAQIVNGAQHIDQRLGLWAICWPRATPDPIGQMP